MAHGIEMQRSLGSACHHQQGSRVTTRSSTSQPPSCSDGSSCFDATRVCGLMAAVGDFTLFPCTDGVTPAPYTPAGHSWCRGTSMERGGGSGTTTISRAIQCTRKSRWNNRIRRAKNAPCGSPVDLGGGQPSFEPSPSLIYQAQPPSSRERLASPSMAERNRRDRHPHS